ncbi:hypothetical protein DSO57_1013134 [Entomophthora muscae]|uniref:Uncharacterized protein n=1 Tax=Entomophthora muscae TaxID=34485 RepID=A0ACC2SUY8_9FUNG|nr:hypothetical protein DSO57_1013134 [Entomophthora muscae]
MFALIRALIYWIFRPKKTEVGLETQGPVNGLLTLAHGALWTGKGNFEKIFKTASFSNIAVIHLFNKDPIYCKVVSVDKQYHFSGPKNVNQPIYCPSQERCLVIASWKSKQLKITKHHVSFGKHGLVKSKIGADSSYFVNVLGPANVSVLFNSINIQIHATFHVFTRPGFQGEFQEEHAAQILPLNLPASRPNGLVGFLF